MLIALALAATVAPAKPAGHSPSAEQVAAAVDTSFSSYDLDGDGQLSRSEFAAMMAKLNAPRTRTWLSGAFRTADRDRSRAVTKAELTSFFRDASAAG